LGRPNFPLLGWKSQVWTNDPRKACGLRCGSMALVCALCGAVRGRVAEGAFGHRRGVCPFNTPVCEKMGFGSPKKHMVRWAGTEMLHTLVRVVFRVFL